MLRLINNTVLLQLLFFLLLPVAAQAQHFEGLIVFERHHKVYPKDSLSSTQHVYDSVQFHIKDGNHTWTVFNPKGSTTTLFRSKENKVYSFSSAGKYNAWIYADEPGKAPISHSIVENADTILGIPCHMYTFYYQNDTSIYYSAPQYTLDYNHYKRYHYGTVADYLRVMNGQIHLRIINKSKERILTTTATRIESKQLSSDQFKLPEGRILIVEKPEQFAEPTKGPDAFGKCVAANLKYPKQAQQQGTEGRVFIGFYVDAKGRLQEPEVVRGIDPHCDAEALRVVSTCRLKWTPARYRGQPVNMRMALPVRFRLL